MENKKYQAPPALQAEWERQVAKDWETATISNGVVFTQVMSNKQILLETLRRVLPKLQIKRVELADPEHALQHAVEDRGYRLDVFATDDQDREYDVEMQVVNQHNLLERSIAYLATIAENQLEKNDDFGQLRPIYIIFFTMFDPFNKGHQVERAELLSTIDGTPLADPPPVTFVYVDVTNDQAATDTPLRSLCRFINDGTVDPNDPFILKLREQEHFAKLDSEWRATYMRISFDQKWNEWEKKQLEQTAEENLAKGRENTIHEAAKYLTTQGNDENTIVVMLKNMFNLSTQQAEDYYHSAVAPA